MKNVHVNLERVTALQVRGIYVYADSADPEPDIQGVKVDMSATQYGAAGIGQVIGVDFASAGGRLIDAAVNVACVDGSANRCIGLRRFPGSGDPLQGRLELDRANIAVRTTDPANPATNQTLAAQLDLGVAIRNSTLRVVRSAENEFAAALRTYDSVLVERSTLAVENSIAEPETVVLYGDNTINHEFYGNIFRGGFTIDGTTVPTCVGNVVIGNVVIGTGFLANTCP